MKRNARIEKALNEIVRRLVADYQPEKIILFGSYAYGEPHKDSDLDLWIVKETHAVKLRPDCPMRYAAR